MRMILSFKDGDYIELPKEVIVSYSFRVKDSLTFAYYEKNLERQIKNDCDDFNITLFKEKIKDLKTHDGNLLYDVLCNKCNIEEISFVKDEVDVDKDFEENSYITNYLETYNVLWADDDYNENAFQVNVELFEDYEDTIVETISIFISKPLYLGKKDSKLNEIFNKYGFTFSHTFLDNLIEQYSKDRNKALVGLGIALGFTDNSVEIVEKDKLWKEIEVVLKEV